MKIRAAVFVSLKLLSLVMAPNLQRRQHRRCFAALLVLLPCFVREMNSTAMSQRWPQRNGIITWHRTSEIRLSKICCRQSSRDIIAPNQLLSDSDVRHIHAAVRKKCLDAIAAGNLPPGRELELISALDLGTVPWSLLPIKLKEQLSLPLADKGIDSLSLNLTVAVQAKDYSEGKAVPLNRLTNFHFMVEAKGSPLKKHVQQLIVATNCNTTLPQQWQWSEAVHRPYAPGEIEEWREKARLAQQEEEETAKVPKQTLERWPHQVECLKKCRKFLKNNVKRDFFVQMATGSGKSLVMADLLASLGSGRRSCIIVPKLDLMEQLAQLLQEMLPSRIARVGTGWPADLSADIFVCVRNSAWQLSNVTFDLLILDEAHHYEPQPGSEVDNSTLGIHAQQVLSLKAPKRIFFTATLLKNKPDFDFSLRCAITAGIIKDYAVMVPVLSEGDPRPGLIEIIQNLPFSRKILAFCNTVCEAKYFTRMLCASGIPADHYNGFTSTVQRKDILKSFQRSEVHGGTRVLVTVDVLSEGVDLPVADTCLFVAPRRGVRLQQCVGRVLRNHSEKVDAWVIAPPVVQQANGTMVEDEELGRLLAELALADSQFKSSLEASASDMTNSRRVGVLGGAGVDPKAEVLDDVARILRVCVFPRVLGQIRSGPDRWEVAFQRLQQYTAEHGKVLVPDAYKTPDGFPLGKWVSRQRAAKKTGKLSLDRQHRLEEVGFEWDVGPQPWDESFQAFLAYKAEHGKVRVPQAYKTPDGFPLGVWVSTQRKAKKTGKLSLDRQHRLEEVGFEWDVGPQPWDERFQAFLAYKAEHGKVRVPYAYKTPDGFRLGNWVNTQRAAKKTGKLPLDRQHRLEEVGFEWDVGPQRWDESFQAFLAYKAEHGKVRVPDAYKTPDGFPLGKWVSRQRAAKKTGKLSLDRQHRLEEVGFEWDVGPWDESFQAFLAYKAEHGKVLVPDAYKTPDGFPLGKWVSRQRAAKKTGKLSLDRQHRLEEVGFEWDVGPQPWDESFQAFLAYKAEHGKVRVPQAYKTPDGFPLGKWASTQRTAKKTGKLSLDRQHRLEEVGFEWDVGPQRWDESFQAFLAYKAEHGKVRVPDAYKTPDGFPLGKWVSRQRTAKKTGKLSLDRQHRLEEVGFEWDVGPQRWDESFQAFLAYKAEHGKVRVPDAYKTPDGFPLGKWVSRQRAAKKTGKLSLDRQHRLEEVGFVWGGRSAGLPSEAEGLS